MKAKSFAAAAVAAVMIVVCCGGRLYGVLPFGAPMYVSVVCAITEGKNRGAAGVVGALSAVYVSCGFLFTFEVWRLYLCGAVVLIAALRWFLALKAAKAQKQAFGIVFSVLAVIADSVLLGVFAPVASAVISGFLGLVFLYFARLASRAALELFSKRLPAPDAAAVCAVIGVGGLAFSQARIGLVYVGAGLAYFTLFMLCMAGVKILFAGGVSLALGMAICDIQTAAALVGAAASLAVFSELPRPVSAVCGVGVFAAFGVLFGLEPIVIGADCAALAVGGLIPCLLPRRSARAFKAYFDYDGSARLAVRHYINRVKADSGNRLLNLASVFDETARLLNAQGEPPPDCAAVGEVMADKICPYCPKYAECDREKAIEAFTAVAERAYSGKAVLTELPEFFTEKCERTADVLAAAGALSDGARAKLKRTEGEDKARAIVTERLAAIKDVLGELGTREAAPVGFDGEAERRLCAELSARGSECAEAFVTRDFVTAVVRTDGAERDVIRRATAACLKRGYEVRALEKTQAAGWSVATLKKRPSFEAVYARAGISKTGGISGDSYTFERIGDRFLVALVDGMGSGEAAGAGSGTAIDLIECFYRAGFDSDSALTGVNRFLKVPNGESFSAADVCVCDLDSGEADIIKLGAPPCYIKTADTVLKIEGSSLPMGVLDEMRPYVAKKRLYPGQMLILASDGVSDCFSGDELPEYINGLAALNPERTADAVLRRALKLVGDVPRDDMTVIAVRLFEEKNKYRAAS